jgi:hypothetical protein
MRTHTHTRTQNKRLNDQTTCKLWLEDMASPTDSPTLPPPNIGLTGTTVSAMDTATDNATASGVYLINKRTMDPLNVQLVDAVTGLPLWTSIYRMESSFQYCPTTNKVFALDIAVDGDVGVHMWDLSSGGTDKRKFGNPTNCRQFRVNSMGTRLLLSREIGYRLFEWSVWDVDGENRLYVLGKSADLQPRFAWKDSRIVFVRDRSLVVVDADTGAEIFSEDDASKYHSRTQLTPSMCGSLVCIDTSTSLFVIDLANCSHLPFRQQYLSNVKAVCFCKDDRSIVVLEEKGQQLSCWSLPEGALLFSKQISTMLLEIGFIVISPGSGAFCCMIIENRAYRCRIRQYDATTGDELGSCREYEVPIEQLIASQEGNILM